MTELPPTHSFASFYRFLSWRWGVYVNLMRLGAVNLDFLRIPVIRQTLRQDTLIRRSLARSLAGWLACSLVHPPARPPARRSLLRSANRRQYFKLRRRLNISIPDPRQREVRIKSTSSALFLRAPRRNQELSEGYENKTHSPRSRENTGHTTEETTRFVCNVLFYYRTTRRDLSFHR